MSLPLFYGIPKVDRVYQPWVYLSNIIIMQYILYIISFHCIGNGFSYDMKVFDSKTSDISEDVKPKPTVNYEIIEENFNNFGKYFDELRDMKKVFHEKFAEIQAFVDSLSQASISPSAFQALHLLVGELSARINTEANNPGNDRSDKEWLLKMIRKEILRYYSRSKKKTDELQAIVDHLSENSISLTSFQDIQTVVDLLASNNNNSLIEFQNELEKQSSEVKKIEKMCNEFESQILSSTGQKSQIDSVKRVKEMCKQKAEEIRKIDFAATKLINYKLTV